MFSVLAVYSKYKFQNLEQCRAYLSASVYRNWPVYFDLQWQLVLFLFDTGSVTVGYMVVQNWKLNYQMSISAISKSNYFHTIVWM